MSDVVPIPDAPGEVAGGILVIGYGNTLRSDDGVGWHAAALLAEDPRFADVDVIACQQLTPELALDVGDATLVVLIDATVEGVAGTITVRRPDGTVVAARPAPAADRSGGGSVPTPADSTPVAAPGDVTVSSASSCGPGATSHHVGAGELLDLAGELYGASPEVLVVGVSVADLGPGDALSPLVAAALPTIADAVAALIADHRRRPAEAAR